MFKRVLVIAAFFSLFAICFAAIANSQDPVKVAKASYTYTIEIILKTTVTPTPDNPVSDICDTCNGKGWVGDATIRQVCPTCDGSGKKKTTTKVSASIGWPPKSIGVKPTPPLKQNPYSWLDISTRTVTTPSVIMYSLTPCPACDVFKHNEAPRLASAIGPHTFEVRQVDRSEYLGSLSFPVFVVRVDDAKPYAFDSKSSRITVQSIKAAVKQLQPNPNK